jgi:hypothetical protein
LALRDPVPRVVQVMAMQDLAREMSPTLNRQSQELADTYFNDNVIDGNDFLHVVCFGKLWYKRRSNLFSK